ncbi:unnamed protein product [Rotaria socialis]|uniref:Uncharacterized protein n=1 Tax=Rotaria socialis TaxID=392032 RepID=A0A821UUW9_9BILA|nr:unnamed protein product [Rotaria socialis]CAF4895363.1 unnamed protein product [Rotaria socialis]
MSAENIYSIKTQGRNSSYPISESSHIHSNNQSEIFNERRCISTTILASSLDHYTKTNSVNYQIVDQPMQLNSSDNSSWIQRCKQSIANIFKQISKPIIKQGKQFYSLT